MGVDDDSSGGTERCPSIVIADETKVSVMDRLLAAGFMQKLFATHYAEDAFDPSPEDPADEPA